MISRGAGRDRGPFGPPLGPSPRLVRAVLPLLVAGGAACGDAAGERSFVPLPARATGDRAAIFAARSRERITRIEAIDLLGSDARWELSTSDPMTVELLLYDRDLGALGLEPGLVAAGPADSRRGLPPPSAVFELRVDGSGASPEGWSEPDRRSPALEAFRLPEDGSECPRVRVMNHPLPSELNGVVAGRLPGGEVLLGDTSGQMWLVSGAEVRPIAVHRAPDGPRPVLTSVAVAPDTGELYFGSNYGEIYQGSLDGDVLEVSFVAAAGTGSYLRFLQVVSGAPEVELYAMSVLGEIFHLVFGESFSRIHDFGRRGDLAGLQGFIWRPGEDGGEVLAVVAEDNRAASIRGGVVTYQDTGSPSGLVEVAEIEGLGPVVGNDLGQLYARVDGVWQPLGPTGVSLWLTVASSVEPGLFLFATAFGNVGLFRDGRSCGVAQLLPADPFWVVPIGPRSERRFIAFGDKPATAGLWYSELWLE